MADNADHNLRTLDGNDTFHGMGLIATVTPGTKQTQVILRRKVNPTEVSACGQIQIQYQRLEDSTEVKNRYRDVCIRKATDPTTNLDVLWKTSLHLEVEANAPDMNDARAEEEAIPGTPAFELQEAHAPYADLMARKKSAEEVSSATAISKIKHPFNSNSRRNPFKTIALPNSGCGTWTWSTF